MEGGARRRRTSCRSHASRRAHGRPGRAGRRAHHPRAAGRRRAGRGRRGVATRRRQAPRRSARRLRREAARGRRRRRRREPSWCRRRPRGRRRVGPWRLLAELLARRRRSSAELLSRRGRSRRLVASRRSRLSVAARRLLSELLARRGRGGWLGVAARRRWLGVASWRCWRTGWCAIHGPRRLLAVRLGAWWRWRVARHLLVGSGGDGLRKHAGCKREARALATYCPKHSFHVLLDEMHLHARTGAACSRWANIFETCGYITRAKIVSFAISRTGRESGLTTTDAPNPQNTPPIRTRLGALTPGPPRPTGACSSGSACSPPRHRP